MSDSREAQKERQQALPLLQMSGVSKQFGSTVALAEVDFECSAGEIHALVGENGAGKSTLLKILTGAVQPDKGEILLAGENAYIRSPRDALNRGIAMVHQELSVLSNLTVAENILLGQEPAIMGILQRGELRKRAESAMTRFGFGLSIRPEEKLDRLDVGQRQAVEICKALAVNARILVLDEPTAALGEEESRQLFSLLRSLKDHNLGIVYVSHHLKEVMSLADQITVLRDGRRTLTAPVDEVTEESLIESMVGRSVGEMFPSRIFSENGHAPVLLAKGIGYGSRLTSIDLSVRPGEIIGVTGLQGAGQQTLGQILAGLIKPTRGELTVNPTANEKARAVAYVPEDRKQEGLALNRPVRENLTATTLSRVLHFGRLMSVRRERKFADEVGSLVSLKGDLEAEVRFLSGGNQQKTLIARCLAERPDVLILDEPTRGVDVGARRDIYEVIHEVANEGAGIVMISSDLLELEGLCDRIIVLRKGKVAAELQGDEATEDEIVRHAQGFYQEPDQYEERKAASDADDESWAGSLHQRLLSGEALIPLSALALIFLIGAISADGFLEIGNLKNLARQTVVVGLVGLGQLFVILTAGIDLSIGAAVGLTNLLSTDMMLNTELPILVIIALAIATGVAIGFTNASLVRFGMPAFLATFAMLSILRGIIVWRYPESIGPVPRSFWALSRHETFGIPTAFIALVVMIVAVAFLLKRTRLGLHIYAVGEEEEAARVSGIRATATKYAAYIAAGGLAGIAGVFLTSRVGAGLPNSGTGLELDSIAVVLIGGASLKGGRGTVLGAIAGVGIVSILSNLLNLWGVDAFYQLIVKGSLIILIAGAWVMLERRRKAQQMMG